MTIAADAGVEEVVRHLFDHPYAKRAWHWESDADYWPAPPAREAEVLTRIFREAGSLLARYADDQVGQGLDHIASPSSAPRLGDELGHLGEGGRLAMSCYMWWDDFPWYVEPDVPERRELDARMLETLAEIVALPSAPCQEAALHGLSHSAVTPPPEAQAIVDRYVAPGAVARPELLRYAKLARTGHVR